jgi:hypothetical protein
MPNGFVQNPSLLVLLQISNKNIKTGSAARGSASHPDRDSEPHRSYIEKGLMGSVTVPIDQTVEPLQLHYLLVVGFGFLNCQFERS